MLNGGEKLIDVAVFELGSDARNSAHDKLEAYPT